MSMSEVIRKRFSQLSISDNPGSLNIGEVRNTESQIRLSNRPTEMATTDPEGGVEHLATDEVKLIDSKGEEFSDERAKHAHAHLKPGTCISGSNRREHWIYGYHLKNRNILRIAKKLGLPWRVPTAHTLYGVQDHIDAVSQVNYKAEVTARGGRPSTILYFAEDDQRKRLRKLKVSRKEMDKVRKAMGLRKGTKPKWYDCDGMKEDAGAEVSSDDEDLPEMKGPVFRNPLYSLPSWMVVNDEDADRTVDMDCEHYGGSVAEVDPHDNPEL